MPLPPHARKRIQLSDPWDYATLAEGVEAWGFRAIQSRGESMSRAEVAEAWFREDYESIVNQARGSAGMHVNAIRRDVVRWRGDLAQTLAKTYVASGDPHSAVRVLEPIVDDDPGREDLAGQLVSAYMAAGQSGRASELRRRFDLKQEV